jgi:hypothetical protein
MGKLAELLPLVNECSSRDELEALLGLPQYALDGHRYEITDDKGTIRQPDRVEVYEVHGCTIDVAFFGQAGIKAFGGPTPTAADVVLRIGEVDLLKWPSDFRREQM